MYRNLQSRFWEDLIDVPPAPKYFYLYLLTNPHTSLCGIHRISLRYITLETGYEEKRVREMFRY